MTFVQDLPTFTRTLRSSVVQPSACRRIVVQNPLLLVVRSYTVASYSSPTTTDRVSVCPNPRFLALPEDR